MSSCIFCNCKNGQHLKLCPIVTKTETERYNAVKDALKAKGGNDGER